MFINVEFKVWTEGRWFSVEKFQTEDIIVAMEKLRALHDVAIQNEQGWNARAIVTWKE